MTVITDDVEAELQEARRSYGDAWREEYLKNFFTHFPTLDDQGSRREQANINRTRDIPYADNAASHIKQKQTPREFYKTIDDTLMQLVTEGLLSRHDIIQATEHLTAYTDQISVIAIRGEPDDQSQDAAQLREFYRVIFPVYVALRKKGYTREDLCD